MHGRLGVGILFMIESMIERTLCTTSGGTLSSELLRAGDSTYSVLLAAHERETVLVVLSSQPI